MLLGDIPFEIFEEEEPCSLFHSRQWQRLLE